jgi:hypothetical protein
VLAAAQLEGALLHLVKEPARLAARFYHSISASLNYKTTKVEEDRANSSVMRWSFPCSSPLLRGNWGFRASGSAPQLGFQLLELRLNLFNVRNQKVPSSILWFEFLKVCFFRCPSVRLSPFPFKRF